MNYDFYHSPIGLLYLESTDTGICSIKLIDQKDQHDPMPSIHTTEAKRELDEYFDRKRQRFEVSLDMSGGTIFQQNVWNLLKEIPYGSTTSYQSIADKLNNPLSVRAVGMANGKNPIPIIVPCHRVIGSSGSLVGYALGIDIKKKLLSLENPKEHGFQTTIF
jgi:methylated-DNA-[protein]-cysteine S-methyltransferase